MGFGRGDFRKPEFKKISDYIWEIDPSFKQGMRVPARIYASKKVLDQMDLHVYDQITNVATLPGITKYAYCMPDGHSGYGFPIGGVAAMDAQEGVISPGGIGFDINCLHPDSRILTSYGYYRKISDLESDFSKEVFISTNLKTKKEHCSSACLFLKKKADTPILKITTDGSEEIILSMDHPLYTGQEFKDAGELKEGDAIIVYPFKGVEYETPTGDVILDEKDITALVGDRKKLILELKNNGLLPLAYNSPALPVLAKLVGFLTGDGWVGAYKSPTRKMDVWSFRALGKPEDLEKIQSDIKKLGYTSNFIVTKSYESQITMSDNTQRTIKGFSTQLHVNSQSLSVLLHALGVPKGNKSYTPTEVPCWVKKAPLWIKRLYLAGLFGAELTRPLQRKGEPYGFTEPSFSQNKVNALEKENLNFMLDIVNLLLEFGVSTNKIYRQKGVRNVSGKETHKLALRISAKADNLIRLWGTIGYEYCQERTKRSLQALAYLNHKRQHLNNSTYKTIVRLPDGTQTVRLNARGTFLTFEEFVTQHTMTDSPFITSRIEKIEILDYDGDVYDLTMSDENHNFIANSIVSHNCGMRLVLTNLTFKDVQPHLRQLVHRLFERVPAGVGSKGFVKLDASTFRKVIEEGGEWCVQNGYGWKDDLEVTELGGRFQEADEKKVSSKAVERGKGQIGTLGSGNHYLEIQHVKPENIIDKALAKKWGLFEDQIVIMFHCGSRGFGHQVATDYLNIFLNVMQSKYGIKILDRELACAPFRSPEGQDYFTAMKCGVNMSFANRQVILHRLREVFAEIFKTDAEKLGMKQVYDVAHNRASLEKHRVDGQTKELIVHRKGATAAYGPGREELMPRYKEDGQPVIIGGSMETGSYLLAGTHEGAATWYTTAHGSGRTMSRTRAKHLFHGEQLQKSMEHRGIYVKSVSFAGLAEEAGGAYKDIDDVINATHNAGISKKVAKLIPIGNVKG